MSRIRSVASSPDGTRIVSGSSDETLQLWDTVSGVHLNTLQGHFGPATFAAFSSDCLGIASGLSHRQWATVSGMVPLLKYLFASFDDDILHLTEPKEALSYFMEDGWIYLANPLQRLCWIPVRCRGPFASCGKQIALGAKNGQVVILDFLDIIA